VRPPPDVGTLRKAGFGARDINHLWLKYYDLCQLAIQHPDDYEASLAALSGVSSDSSGGGVVLGCKSNDSVPANRLDDKRVKSGEPEPTNRGGTPSASSGSEESNLAISCDPSTYKEFKKHKTRRGTRGRARKKTGLSGNETSSLPFVGSCAGEGFSYGALFDPQRAESLMRKFGPSPSLRRVLTVGPGYFRPWQELATLRMRLFPLSAHYVGCVPGKADLVAFTTLVRSVPLCELRKSWRPFVEVAGPCYVPGVRAQCFGVA